MINIEDAEVDLHEMCNIQCAHCTHVSPLFTNKDPSYSIQQFTKDIQNLKRISNIHSLRIVGGEPFLNKQLDKYLQILKDSKVATEIKIFTNGLILDKVDKSIFEIMADNCYPISLKISVYSNLEKEKIEKIQSNIQYLKETFPTLDITSNEISYFLKYNILEENTNKELVQKIYNKCYYSYRHKGVSFFNGRLYKCFASRKKYKLLDHYNKLTDKLKERLNPSTIDSIPIDENTTSQQIEDFLSTTTALEGCKFCLGTCGKAIPHQQINKTLDNNIASLEDLDFETGEIYISNNILSWDRFNPTMGDTKYNKFFKIEHLKHYLKFFKFKPT